MKGIKAMSHEHEFIVVGPYCWGKGNTSPEAWKNCKKNWIKAYGGNPIKSKATCYKVPVGSTVNSIDGSIHFPLNTKRCPDCKKIEQKQWRTR